MMDLITQAFLPMNLPLTVLLLLMVLYWITVIIGVLDVDLFHIHAPDSDIDFHTDFDLHTDVDADIHADIDTDVDTDLHADVGHDHDGGDIGTEGGIGWSILRFFYVGEVPIMVLSSVLILSLWTISMAANQWLNPTRSFLLAFPLLAGNLVVSLFICKVVGMPLRKMYRSLNVDSNASRTVIGRICVVTTTTVSQRMGQAEMKSKGAPILLNVVSEGGHEFKKGDEAVVTGKIEDKGVYTIAPVDLEI